MTTEDILLLVLIISFAILLLFGEYGMDRMRNKTNKAIDKYKKQELKNPFLGIENIENGIQKRKIFNEELGKHKDNVKKDMEEYMKDNIMGVDSYDDSDTSNGSL